jgi:two-component sensor histidine kinase
MSIEQSPSRANKPPSAIFAGEEPRTAASYETELTELRDVGIRLREEVAHDEDLLRQKDEAIDQLDLLSRESNHRLLNDLQIVVSLLSLQSRKAEDPETASQLAAAASRIATIARVHQRLHYIDNVQSLALKQFLEDFCREFSMLLAPEQAIVVEGIEIILPATTAIPLSFIVNELITNAVKYGEGGIVVCLEPSSKNRYALSVSNDGPVLPEGFDIAASTGQGMQIVRSFVARIGGELRIGRGGNDRGARFTVLFA